MRIIEIGKNVQETQMVCPCCESKIAYTKGDIVDNVFEYIQCPVCSSLIAIEKK